MNGPLLVTVVGAGPFTVALVDALAAAPDASSAGARPIQLRLLGRDEETLAALAVYAADRLDGVVSVGTDHGLLDGADVVLVQVRPGGSAGRIADEHLAASLGVAADESLGLGGLRTVLRGAPVLRGLAAELLARCPDALVLVLTNPLSSFVAELTRSGLTAVGCCELPTVTACQAAEVLGLRTSELGWDYSGLSHRGFLHGLRGPDGTDRLPALVVALTAQGSRIGTVAAGDIASLGALPMKYHGLLRGTSSVHGRAAAVGSVRSDLRAELLSAPRTRPGSLSARPTPWYEVMVAPVLRALAGGASARLVLDLPSGDGLVREGWAVVDARGVRPEPPSGAAVPAPAAGLIATYEAQERAWAALLAAPGLSTLAAAVACDPAIPEAAAGAVVDALLPEALQLAVQPVLSHWSAT